MSDTTVTRTKRLSSADNQLMSSKILTQIDHLEALMDKDIADSQVITAEIQIIKAHTAQTLSQLTAQVQALSKAI